VVQAHGVGQRNVLLALRVGVDSEASPRQYSVDELVKKIFGTRRRAVSLASRLSLRPVTGTEVPRTIYR
jgi:hypothetical protein